MSFQEQVEQHNNFCHLLFVQLLAHHQIDDPLGIAALGDMTLAPPSLFLGIGQYHAASYSVTLPCRQAGSSPASTAVTSHGYSSSGRIEKIGDCLSHFDQFSTGLE